MAVRGLLSRARPGTRRTAAALAIGGVAVLVAALTWLAPRQSEASPASLALCGNPSPPPSAVQHVIVVMLENHSYSGVIGNAAAPFQNQLAAQCGSATAMFGATHSSAANYLAVSAGQYPLSSPPGCGSVGACADSSDNLYHQLTAAGLTGRGYMESMPSACDSQTAGNYKIGHNPILFYSDLPNSQCQSSDIGDDNLAATSGPFWTDLQNQTLPALSWITPSLADDGEGGLQAADTWLRGFLGAVAQSASYLAGGTLVLVTYDEGGGSDYSTGENCANASLDLPVSNGISAHQESCHVPLFVAYPYTPAGSSDATFLDHYSITRTVEQLFGLPYLAHAADAQTASLVGHFGIPQPGTSPPSATPSPSASPPPSATPSPSGRQATACPAAAPGAAELSANVSVQADQTGWTGVYTSNSQVTRVQPSGGSYDGSWALQVAPAPGTSGAAGVNNAHPAWVPGPPGAASIAGQSYTGSAVVRAGIAGEQVSLLVREVTPGGSGVGYHATTVTLPDTGWHQLSSQYLAQAAGDLIKYSLYASNLAGSAQYFQADCLSLQASG